LHLEACPLARGERSEKIAGSPGRVAPLDEIERRTQPLLDLVPITRISEISRLAPSAMPVFSATTPLARDLTTHMGKGPELRSARMSAVMEAIERVSAERFNGPAVTGSHAGLIAGGRNCVHPEAFDLPPSTSYHPDRIFDWAEGWDLMKGRPVFIPVDLCVTPPGQGLLDQADTNGVASGATYGEAIRHALLELVERDATGQHLFASLFASDSSRGPRVAAIDPDTLPDRSRDLMARIARPPRNAALFGIETEIGIPVVACMLRDPAYPAASGPVGMTFGGWGCELRLEHAVNRAVAEACQSWVGTIHGTRDSFNIVENPAAHLAESKCAEPPFWTEFPETGDVAQDVGIILARLSAAGIKGAVVVDMTDPALGIPVVRVRVPGLSAFMADRRRIGWRLMRHLL
jgi:ribosomal protein S12 methylthiotransferase accessory factor